MPPRAPDVFISYARPDEEFAQRLEGRLKMIGFEVFRDRSSLRPGAEVSPAIFAAVDAAGAVVGILSRESVGRDFVRREWDRGRDKLYLLRLDDTDVPDNHRHRHATDEEDALVSELLENAANGCCEVQIRHIESHGDSVAVEISSARDHRHRQVLPGLLQGALPSLDIVASGPLREDGPHPFDDLRPHGDRVGLAVADVLALQDVPVRMRIVLDPLLMGIPWSALWIRGRHVVHNATIDLALLDVEGHRRLRDDQPVVPRSHVWLGASPPHLEPQWRVLHSTAQVDGFLAELDNDPTNDAFKTLESLFVIDVPGTPTDFIRAAEESARGFRPLCIILRCSFGDLRRPEALAMARHSPIFCHVPLRLSNTTCTKLVDGLVRKGVNGLREVARDLRNDQPLRPWLWATVYAHPGDDDGL